MKVGKNAYFFFDFQTFLLLIKWKGEDGANNHYCRLKFVWNFIGKYKSFICENVQRDDSYCCESM
jgi:hypothetical protein